MHRLLFLVCLMGALAVMVHAQESPATAPAETDTVSHDDVSFTPPPGWRLLGRRPDDLSVGYALDPGLGQIVIVVAPQQQSIPDELAPKLQAQIIDLINSEARKGELEVVTRVTSEDDRRFLLKLHDRFRSQATFVDRMQWYAGVGKNLVSVVSSAFTEDEAEAAKIHAVAQWVMLEIHLNRPGLTGRGSGPAPDLDIEAPKAAGPPPTSQPTLFREARLRIPPPAGWIAEPSGNATGLIVLWRDPDDSASLVAVSYRTVPVNSQDDASVRNLAIQQLARGEKPELQVAGGKPIGQPQRVPDSRFLSKSRIDYDVNGQKARITFRQVRAGDGVVSITSLSLMEKADDIETLADNIAEGVRATTAAR